MDVLCRGAGAVVVAVAIATGVLRLDPVLGSLVVIGVPASVLAMVPLWRPLERRTAVAQARLSEATDTAADVLGLRVVKGIGAKAVVRQRYGTVAGPLRTGSL